MAIDAYSLFYKTYFALQNRPLTTSSGLETTVIFSTLNILHSLLKAGDYTRAVFAAESRVKTRRKEKYEAYKATRSPMPESLGKQIDLSFAVLEALGAPVLSIDGFEADDVLASLALEAKERGMEAFLYTSDKDLTQIVGEGVVLIGSSRQGSIETTGREEVKAKWGVYPEKMLDLLSLVGDVSDNVPGVAGVGPKSAAKLLETYASLEGLYARLEEVSPKGLQEKLALGKEQVFFSRELIRLERTPKFDFDLLKLRSVDRQKALDVLSPLETPLVMKKYGLFASSKKTFCLDDFKNEAPAEEEKKQWSLQGRPREITNKEDLEGLRKLIQEKKHMIFDFETTSLEAFSAEIVSVSVGFKDEDELYFVMINPLSPEKIDLFHSAPEEASKIDFKTSPIARVLEDASIEKIGHNLKYEWMVCKAQGVELRGKLTDTMLREFLINSSETSYKLEKLVLRHFGEEKQTYDDLVSGGELADVPKEKLVDYALSDVEATKRLYFLQEEKWDEAIEACYAQMDEPLARVLGRMEMSGVVIDKKKLFFLEEDFKTRIASLSKEIFALSGEEFNLNSPKQLSDVLFGKMGVPPLKKTKTGYSTDVEVLEKLSSEHEICRLMVDYRSLQKLLGTYAEALPKMIHPKTGRIHTHYNQAVASTGRLSSSNPNLQNIPVKSGDGRLVREAFVAPEGFRFLSADYSQVELRVLAELSGEENLLRAFKDGRDVHLETAKALFGMELPNEDQRRIGKTINFSLLYGASAYSLSESLKVPFGAAKALIEGYFKAYPRLEPYMREVLEEAKSTGFAKTYYGRRRPIEGLSSSNKNVRERAERMAFNSVVQGTASDIIKKAMIKIDSLVEEGALEAEMVMQVHDELVFYLPFSADLERSLSLIQKAMTEVEPFEKLLEVKIEVSAHWS